MKITIAPLAAVAVALALCGPLGAAEPLKVKVESGTLIGQLDGDVATFRGVPFAAPPVRALRWAPTQRPFAWRGDREALKNAPACMQTVNADGRPNGGGYAGPVSEDCLYLNVFAPKSAKKAPVMVWIMETIDDFSFERKASMDDANEKVREWEALMWKYQQPLPWAKDGEKWILMNRIFQL